MTTITMPVLYKKLKKLDPSFTEKYIREQGLPSWWDKELDNKPTATLEGAGHISQRLNIDLLSLLQEEQPRFKDSPQTKFKYHLQEKADTPETAYRVASSVAATVARATELEFKPIPTDPQQIRREILEKHPQVTLYSLLDYCWEHGIAVVYFNHFPKNSRKITGMIQRQNNQPVIVLSSSYTHPAWLAFHLAHELGHLALGHLKDDEKILIDDEIDSDSDDPEEQTSNQFAVSLLLDNLDNTFSKKSFRDAKAFAHYLEIKFKAGYPTINLAAIAFNYAWHKNKLESQKKSKKTRNYFPLANAAVKLLDGDHCGKAMMHNFLENHLDWEELSDDTIDHLEVILGE